LLEIFSSLWKLSSLSKSSYEIDGQTIQFGLIIWKQTRSN